jgi:orotate phosphoribosyltransferase
MKKLLKLLKTHSVKRGSFDLSNGGKTDLYIDCKPTLLLADGIDLASELIIDSVIHFFKPSGKLEIEKTPLPLNLVAGVETGGYPLATAVSLKSRITLAIDTDALYIRKTIKNHGSKSLIEGIYKKGQSVILLEDTITSGHSCLNALAALKDAELNPIAVISIVDRLEGGAVAIKENFNIPTISLFTIKDFQ